jgi:hypothetical protein
MAGNKLILGTRDGKVVVLNPTCLRCNQRVPASYLNAAGVCYDCQEPLALLAMSRSLVSVSRVKSAIRRRQHHNGEIS